MGSKGGGGGQQQDSVADPAGGLGTAYGCKLVSSNTHRYYTAKNSAPWWFGREWVLLIPVNLVNA